MVTALEREIVLAKRGQVTTSKSALVPFTWLEEEHAPQTSAPIFKASRCRLKIPLFDFGATCDGVGRSQANLPTPAR